MPKVSLPHSVAVAGKHEGKPGAFFLDGPNGFSFAGSEPFERLVVDPKGDARVWRDGRWRNLDLAPLEAIALFIADGEAAADYPGFVPRTVGFLAYEMAAQIENVSVSQRGDHDGTPLAVLSTYQCVDVWDPRDQLVRRIDFTEAPRTRRTNIDPLHLDPSVWQSTPRLDYQAAFHTVREAIAAGDIYQASLTRRTVFTRPKAADCWSLFRELHAAQPVPHGATLDFGGFQVLSNSPELFLRVDGDHILTAPIKGTRPRDADTNADEVLQRDLMTDAKERAEHVMIVDLERNDLGRVCCTGSVEAPRQPSLLDLTTVRHLVSEVRGLLRDEVGVADILRATFPGGSITGAPKVRAMEILAEVEPSPRGVYTGAIGGFNGPRQIELNIAIRTAVLAGDRILYSTGGGVVADSRCDAEWDESELKALALRRALADHPTQRRVTAGPANENSIP